MSRRSLGLLVLVALLAACGSTPVARTPASRSPSASPSGSPSVRASPSTTPINLPPAPAIRVPTGFSAYVYSAGLQQLTALAFGPDGRLYATGAGGTVAVIAGPGSPAQVLISGLPTAALGLAWRDNDLFVSVRGSIRSYHLGGAALSGGAAVVSGLPSGRHQNDNILLSPSGDFLVGVGSTCDVCTEFDPRSATVLRFGADWSYTGIVVRGARNPYGLALRASDGQAYVTINGQDNLGGQPADHLLPVIQGENAGWPRCWPSFPDGSLHGSCAGVASPIAVFAPHSSADGIAFYESAAFGADYRENAFVTEWGANAGGPTGRRVERVVLSGSGSSERGTVTDFATGFEHPLPILVAPDGGLLVGDYGNGQIIEIAKTS